jgi:hypothetical protein
VRTFQASYRFRSDGAAWLDIYSRDARGNHPFSHDTYAILNRHLEFLRQVPDQNRSSRERARAYPEALLSPV